MLDSVRRLAKRGLKHFGNYEVGRRIAADMELANRLDRLSLDVETLIREQREVRRAMTLPPRAGWANGAGIPAGTEPPLGIVFEHATICRQAEMETPGFGYWSARMAHAPAYHRKLWEFVFIAQVLYERGMLRPGMRGLGFGVGSEPLPSLFAAHGCEIVGTDMDYDTAVAAGWLHGNQHAAAKEQMFWPAICPRDSFERLVSFETFDMNRTPGHHRGYDFCWSSCALEHLGSIEHGLAFIENSLDCLRPGGLAVHTTEYNLSSNDATVDHAPTVLFRRQDFERLATRIAASGNHVAPFDLREGGQPLDQYVDMPPYLSEPHLRLALEGFATTSIGLIFARAA